MLYRLLFVLSIFNLSTQAQTTIAGLVTDTKQNPLPGANIYIKDSYDGTSSNEKGEFSFTTTANGSQLLVLSVLGFEARELAVDCQGRNIKVEIRLKEAFNSLNAVNITAGVMEASDEKRSVVFKPIDIVTTAGAAVGDITSALNTLPGTATIGDDGRLFVRGGDASETAIFFDGLKVNSAYGSSLGGIPSRSRFSPQLFTGTFFSTGGYSAEYGQALSSALVLSTVDMPLRSQSDLSLMSVGGSGAHTQLWDKTAITATLSYIDLSPYQALVPHNIEFDRAPHNFTGEFLFRQQLSKRSLVKAFYSNQQGGMSIERANPGEVNKESIDLANQFHYANANWDHAFNKYLKLYTGLSYSFNSDDTGFDSLQLNRREDLIHAKSKLSYYSGSRLQVEAGLEHFRQNYQESMEGASREGDLPLSAAFAEGQYHLSEKLALRAGLRSELFQEVLYFMPRLSSAYQLSNQQQLSLAYGKFYQQQPAEKLLLHSTLAPALSTHYIASYQWTKEYHTFRLELFHKEYSHLLREWNGDIEASGEGYAKGFDLFYRDRKTFKNTDYWISYSFVDSKRQYAGFSGKVQPGFAPRHNASVVAKHWLDKLNSQLGLGFSLNDGYAYDNPNLPGEQESKTRMYHSLNLNWSYLPRPNLIIHASVSNVLGTDNVFGYRYSLTPGGNGSFSELAVGQVADRFFFIGVFLTLSDDKKANQLNNL